MKRFFLFFFLVSLVSLSFLPLQAQNGRHDLRFLLNSTDCTDSIMLVDIEIRAFADSNQFLLGSQNYRFSFNRAALANPRINQELAVSGLIQHGPGVFSFYNPHNLQGSTDTIVSLNVVFALGQGYPVDETAWVPVCRIAFDIVDFDACADLWIHTKDPVDFPNTVLTEVVGPVELPVDDGQYNDLNFCISDSCGTPGGGNPSCGKDVFEPNEAKPESAQLFNGFFSGMGNTRICPQGDNDWFKFQNNVPGQTLSINLTNLPADYNLELHNSAGLLASSGALGLADEKITFPNAFAGTYYVRVYGNGGAWDPFSPYSLSVNFISPSPQGGGGVKSPLGGSPIKVDADALSAVVFPNPCAGSVEIGWEMSEPGLLSLSLMDLPGRLIRNWTIEGVAGWNQSSVNLDRIPAGTYLVKGSTKGVNWSEKLIISGM
jgi:hypothetical protein